MSALADAAVALGLPVFPCGDNKAPFLKGGFKISSNDPAEIRRLFADSRARMIGVPTGRRSGLFVVDIDIRDQKSGQEWFDQFEMRNTTRTHRTRSGGHHLVYQAPQTFSLGNTAGKLAQGVDTRGDGGFVIHPPSPAYTVSYGGPIEPLPDWLVAVLRPPPVARPFTGPRREIPATVDYARRALLRSVDKVARSGQGGRNDTLNRQAYRLGTFVGARLLDMSEVASELFAAGLQAGLTEREIKATLHSGITAGMKMPQDRGRG